VCKIAFLTCCVPGSRLTNVCAMKNTVTTFSIQTFNRMICLWVPCYTWYSVIGVARFIFASVWIHVIIFFLNAVATHMLHLIVHLLSIFLTSQMGAPCHWVVFPGLHLTPLVYLLLGRTAPVLVFHTAPGGIQPLRMQLHPRRPGRRNVNF